MQLKINSKVNRPLKQYTYKKNVFTLTLKFSVDCQIWNFEKFYI